MTTFILLPFFFSHLPINDPDTLLIELHPVDSLSFDKKVSVAFEHREITHLTIELKVNQDVWIVFGNFPGRSDIENDPNYSIKYPVVTLPNNFGNLTGLQSLKVSFLGLDSLPGSIT